MRRRSLLDEDFVQPAQFYFNLGESTDFTDPLGRVWKGLLGTNNYPYGPLLSSYKLWETVVYGTGTTVTLPVPAGTYQVTAYLKEVYTSKGQRTSGLQLQGGAVLYTNVDGYVGPQIGSEYGRPPAVITQTLTLPANPVFVLLGSNTPILNAMSLLAA
jgi:hypothetical protein